MIVARLDCAIGIEQASARRARARMRVQKIYERVERRRVDDRIVVKQQNVPTARRVNALVARATQADVRFVLNQLHRRKFFAHQCLRAIGRTIVNKRDIETVFEPGIEERVQTRFEIFFVVDTNHHDGKIRRGRIG